MMRHEAELTRRVRRQKTAAILKRVFLMIPGGLDVR
jgi:hypothetical protein